MRVAIIHYHLLPGGVTQVIANHLQSLKQFLHNNVECTVAILHGGRNDDFQNLNWEDTPGIKVSVHAISELGYDRWPDEPLDGNGLAKNILSTLKEIDFSPSNSVIHVHNHSLGKNASLPDALHKIAGRGYPMLLQIHDFAEDFRTDQYQRLATAGSQYPGDFRERLYPQAGHIHYAVLNGRDQKILAASGVSDERLHVVPNPIVNLGALPNRAEVRERMHRDRAISFRDPLVIYPVRCIRRKNIGEMLLWSAVFNHRASFGNTLAPRNVAEQPSYDRWRSLAKDLKLPCYFELGEAFSFKENLSAADALITTSVAEGFGMVFLESQLAERPLIGRKLPEITDDFEGNEVDLSLLYDSLTIPVDLLGTDRIYESIFSAYLGAIEKYGFADRRKAVASEYLRSVLATGGIDFSRLTPALQEDVVIRATRDKQVIDVLLHQNPLLQDSIPFLGAQEKIEGNARAVRKYYAPQATGEALANIYNQLLSSSDRESVCSLSGAEIILDNFIGLPRFCPLRSMP